MNEGRIGTTESDREAPPPLEIPGGPEQIAREIDAVSPEGRPGDPKAAPRLLRREVGILFVAILGLAVLIGVFFGWIAGGAALALGTIGLLVNPVVGATSERAKEREPVLRHHLGEQDVIVRKSEVNSRPSSQM